LSGFNWTPEQIAWLTNEAPKFMVAQNRHVQDVADKEAARRAALSPEERGETPITDDASIRANGGYLLNDDQWVVSEGFGLSGAETNTPEHRRSIILDMAEAGNVLPFERDGEVAGFFPSTPNAREQIVGRPDRAAKIQTAKDMGNGLIERKLMPSVYVRGMN